MKNQQHSKTQQQIKCFYGLPISVAHGLEWRSVIMRSSPELARQARWTGKDNFHITMRFFGLVSEQQLAEVEAAVAPLLKGQRYFDCQADNISHFPTVRSNIIATNIILNSEILALHQRLESTFMSLGFAPNNRHFNPHVTLCRIKKSVGLHLVPQPLKSPIFTQKRLILYRSLPADGGNIYVPLRAYPFEP